MLNALRMLRASIPPQKPSEEEADSVGEDPITITRRLIEQTHAMHQALSQIAQVVITTTAIKTRQLIER